MAKASRPKNPFAGRWRITWMEQWDQDFVDAEVEGYFKFGPRNLGSFQFGYVQGEIDNRLTSRDGKPCLEFTWEGNVGARSSAQCVRYCTCDSTSI
jgi:hypothetical protein